MTLGTGSVTDSEKPRDYYVCSRPFRLGRQRKAEFACRFNHLREFSPFLMSPCALLLANSA